MKTILVLLLLTLLSVTAVAIDNKQELDDPVLQARYLRLGNELRCLVCQNQSIADSTADLAADLRGQVRQMLVDGASDDEILDYMTARYGDFVRYRPDFRRTWGLWVGPFAMLAIGLLIVGTIIRRYVKQPTGTAGD